MMPASIGSQSRSPLLPPLLPQVERAALSGALRFIYRDFGVSPYSGRFLPPPRQGQRYVLYLHVPFCHQLCPYCFFTRYPFVEGRARHYFKLLREEMRLAADLGYDFASLYVGGGTPTILVDELIETIDLAGELFSLAEVSVETNPNHLRPEVASPLIGRVQRLSVGVQTFDDGLLRQVQRYDKYGSGEQIFDHLRWAAGKFPTVNVDMIFNLPGQTEQMLKRDIAMIRASGVNQTTFHPLMTSPMTERALEDAVGRVDYRREAALYHMVVRELGDGFQPTSAWSYSRQNSGALDEYIIDYPEYVGLGTGSFSYLNGTLYVNVFSLDEFERALSSSQMSAGMSHHLSRKEQMRYRFMTELFGLHLDKQRFRRDFGIPVSRGLWLEMLFMRLARAFAIDDDAQLTLTQQGRYLMTVIMREFFVRVNSVRERAREHIARFPASIDEHAAKSHKQRATSDTCIVK